MTAPDLSFVLIHAGASTLTVDDCVASIVQDVADRAEAGDLVLVAHSSGGLFAPGVAAALAPRVRHIVLSSGCVPTEGGLGLEAMKASYARRNVTAMEAARRDGRTLTTPGPPEDPEVLRHAYGVELDDDQLAFVAAPERNPKDSQNIYFQPVSWAAAAGMPVTCIRQLRDTVTPLELQDEMIGRLPSPELVTVVELDTGHIPAVTHPAEMAAILDRVAGIVVG